MTIFEDLLTRAEAGDAKAQFSLAETYHNGIGVPQDMGRAVVWYTQAALQEYPNALYGLRQAARNEVEGARLHLEAFEGDGKAKFALALAFKEGRGVRQSDVEATRWYLLAVEQGHSLAQSLDEADWEQLASAEAERREEKAATDGNIDKQVALGRRYHNGEGVRRTMRRRPGGTSWRPTRGIVTRSSTWAVSTLMGTESGKTMRKECGGIG